MAEQLFEISKDQIQKDSIYNDQFKALSKKISMLLSCEGIHRKPYFEGLPYFSALSEDKKRKAVESLSFYQDLCVEQIGDGYKLKDSLSFTWRAFRKLGFTPRSDLFEHITDDHVIEVYSSEGMQIYRNMKCYEFSSYSFEELYSFEWWNLYSRDAIATQKMFEAGAKVFSGEVSENFVPDIPTHIIQELRSADKLTIEFKVDLLGPLYRNKRPEGVIVLERPRLLSN